MSTSTHEIGDMELMALADGELSEPEAGAVRHAIETDPRLAARYELFVASNRVLKQAFSGIEQEPVPERLLAAARGEGRNAGDARATDADGDARSGSASVSDSWAEAPAPRAPGAAPSPRAAPMAAARTIPATGGRHVRRTTTRRWWAAAMAASLVAAVTVGLLAGRQHGSPAPMIALHSDPAPLQAPLSTLRSGDIATIDVEGTRMQVIPVASFEASGTLCREFEAMRPDGGGALRGVACAKSGAWTVDRVTDLATAAPDAPSGNYAPAGASDSLIAGYPGARRLTPGEEDAAIRARWSR